MPALVVDGILGSCGPTPRASYWSVERRTALWWLDHFQRAGLDRGRQHLRCPATAKGQEPGRAGQREGGWKRHESVTGQSLDSVPRVLRIHQGDCSWSLGGSFENSRWAAPPGQEVKAGALEECCSPVGSLRLMLCQPSYIALGHLPSERAACSAQGPPQELTIKTMPIGQSSLRNPPHETPFFGDSMLCGIGSQSQLCQMPLIFQKSILDTCSQASPTQP